MTRAAIYVRYSSDLQEARSIDDQVAFCRGYADANGMTVAVVFSDHARSGASLFGREGLLAMMDAARDRNYGDSY